MTARTRYGRAFSRDSGALTFVGLLLARTSVAFQFQSVTVLALPIADGRRLGSGEVGLLLSLYMGFGLVLAVSSPLIARRLGVRRPMLAALALMAAGQMAVAQPLSFEWIATFRALAGLGGSLIYVMAFEVAAALPVLGSVAMRIGLVAATWPLGNALALLLVPALGEAAGLQLALCTPLALIAAGMMLVGWPRASSLIGPSRGGAHPGAAPGCEWLATFGRVWPAGLAFALYNAAFILFTSFSAQLFSHLGYPMQAAAWLASLPMWLFLLSVPAGGWIAARLRNRDKELFIGGCLASAACFMLASFTPSGWIWIVLAGLIGGLPTAPILAVVSRQGGSTAGLTFGTLFTIFFAAMLVLSPLVGRALQVWNPMALVVATVLLLVSACGLTAWGREHRMA